MASYNRPEDPLGHNPKLLQRKDSALLGGRELDPG